MSYLKSLKSYDHLTLPFLANLPLSLPSLLLLAFLPPLHPLSLLSSSLLFSYFPNILSHSPSFITSLSPFLSPFLFPFLPLLSLSLTLLPFLKSLHYLSFWPVLYPLSFYPSSFSFSLGKIKSCKGSEDRHCSDQWTFLENINDHYHYLGNVQCVKSHISIS